MSNVRVIAATTPPPFFEGPQYDPDVAHSSEDVPERFVQEFEGDELEGEAIPVIIETIEYMNETCEHGLSADLCEGEGHYPRELDGYWS